MHHIIEMGNRMQWFGHGRYSYLEEFACSQGASSYGKDDLKHACKAVSVIYLVLP
jgi:hypothetical protein